MTDPTRQVPPEFRAHCVHATLCPGCPLIRDSYGEQLAKKTARVRAAASGFFELAHVSVQPTAQPSSAEGYRTRAKLVADAKGALGLYGRGTHELVDLPECRVLHPGSAAWRHSCARCCPSMLVKWRHPPSRAWICRSWATE